MKEFTSTQLRIRSSDVYNEVHKAGSVAINHRDRPTMILIIDLNTGEELESKTGFLWGGKDILLGGDEPLLTPEHFEGDPEDASYGILIFRCDAAINV